MQTRGKATGLLAVIDTALAVREGASSCDTGKLEGLGVGTALSPAAALEKTGGGDVGKVERLNDGTTPSQATLPEKVCCCI